MACTATMVTAPTCVVKLEDQAREQTEQDDKGKAAGEGRVAADCVLPPAPEQ